MSVSDMRAVIGTSNRHIWVYDMRSLVEPEQRRVSSLKFQTRCVRVFPDQMGYAVGSVEGRVAVEYFDTSKVGSMICYLCFSVFVLFVVFFVFFACFCAFVCVCIFCFCFWCFVPFCVFCILLFSACVVARAGSEPLR